MNDATLAALRGRIQGHEGRGPTRGGRFLPYTDSVGVLTIGWGRAIGQIGISPDEADLLLTHDIQRAIADLDFGVRWWRSLDEVRQSVLVELCFQLGLSGVLDFRRFRDALEHGRYDAAAAELLDSKLATQAVTRTRELAAMIATGRLEDDPA